MAAQQTDGAPPASTGPRPASGGSLDDSDKRARGLLIACDIRTVQVPSGELSGQDSEEEPELSEPDSAPVSPLPPPVARSWGAARFATDASTSEPPQTPQSAASPLSFKASSRARFDSSRSDSKPAPGESSSWPGDADPYQTNSAMDNTDSRGQNRRSSIMENTTSFGRHLTDVSSIRICRRRSNSFIAVHEQDAARAPCVQRFVDSSWFDAFISLLVMVNLFLMCQDSDARADYPGKHAPGDPPDYVFWGMAACFCVFTCELVLRLFVEGRKFWNKWLNRIDFVIILGGVVEYMLELVGMGDLGFSLLRMARLFRLMRLMRLFRLVSGFSELRRLVAIVGGCVKTLFWSFLLLLLVMTMWAIMAVELVNPIAQDLVARGTWSGCERCGRAFSSVFMANLTFFQTIVAGDSWGQLACPIIEEAPLVAVIFAGSLMTLVFGVLNLIVAVIVDTFAESRANDIIQMAKDREDEETSEKRVLSEMFKSIDESGDGTITYDELFNGAHRVADFARWLRVLDIDQGDLQDLFELVDEEGTGQIEMDRFVNCMYRLKHTESKTATRLIKHMVSQLYHRSDIAVEALVGRMQRMEESMTESFVKQEKSLQKAVHADENPLGPQELQQRLIQHEEEFQEKLRRQEESIKLMLEEALGKTPEVAYQAALDAARAKVDEVMSSVRRTSFRLTGGMSCRLEQHRLRASRMGLGSDSRLQGEFGGLGALDESPRGPHCQSRLDTTGRSVTHDGPSICWKPSPLMQPSMRAEDSQEVEWSDTFGI